MLMLRRKGKSVVVWLATGLTLLFGDPALAAGTNTWLTYRWPRRPSRQAETP
jgi:hypothetical protein